MTRRALPKLIEDLRAHQAELEAQNTALEYSRIAAEGASERFESLFSNVPLALMVIDELGMVEQSNAMALELFRPKESDPPLNFLPPLVTPVIEASALAAGARADPQAQRHLRAVRHRAAPDPG